MMEGKKELEEILSKGKFSKLEKTDFDKILKYLDEDKDFIINYFDQATDALAYLVTVKGYIDWFIRDDINVHVVRAVADKIATTMKAYEFEKVIEYLEPDFLFIYDILRRLPKGRLREWVGLVWDKEYFDEWKMLNREYTLLSGAILLADRRYLISTHFTKLEAFAYSYNFPQYVREKYKVKYKEDYYSLVTRANLGEYDDPEGLLLEILSKNKHFHLTYKAIMNLAKNFPDAPWVALETLRSRTLKLAENKRLLRYLDQNVGKVAVETNR
jgi:hypothetical protein